MDVSGEWYWPTTDGKCQLYVRELGPEDGEPVIVLHGGAGAEHSYLLEAVRPLAETRRVVLYDQRGCLRSPAPIDSVSLDTYVDDLDNLRADLGFESVDLMGHSYGTHLALWFARLRPGRARRLALVSPPRASDRLDEEEQAICKRMGVEVNAYMQRPELFAELDRLGFRQVDPERHNAKQATHFWRIHFARANIHDISRWRHMEGGQAFYNDDVGRRLDESIPRDDRDLRDVVKDHPHPIHIIQGDHDFCDFGPTWSRRWFSGLDHVTLTVVNEAGHNLWIDQPHQWSQALTRALGGSSAR